MTWMSELPAHAALRLAAKAEKAIADSDARVGAISHLADTLMKAVPQADSDDRRNVVLGALLEVYETAHAHAREVAVKDANAQLGGFQEAVRLQIENLCRRKIAL